MKMELITDHKNQELRVLTTPENKTDEIILKNDLINEGSALANDYKGEAVEHAVPNLMALLVARKLVPVKKSTNGGGGN